MGSLSLNGHIQTLWHFFVCACWSRCECISVAALLYIFSLCRRAAEGCARIARRQMSAPVRKRRCKHTSPSKHGLQSHDLQTLSQLSRSKKRASLHGSGDICHSARFEKAKSISLLWTDWLLGEWSMTKWMTESSIHCSVCRNYLSRTEPV